MIILHLLLAIPLMIVSVFRLNHMTKQTPWSIGIFYVGVAMVSAWSVLNLLPNLDDLQVEYDPIFGMLTALLFPILLTAISDRRRR